DCPNDLIRNRLGVADLRLISGKTAVHSDMLMWHPEEDEVNVAHQLLGVMFSVPQISVRLENYSEEHKAVLRSFLSFWREHRETLLDGEFYAEHPEDNYSVIGAEKDGEQISVRYAAVPFRIGHGVKKAYLFNSTEDNISLICASLPLDGASYRILDYTGKVVADGKFGVVGKTTAVLVPAAGRIEIEMSDRKSNRKEEIQ
ncbi:MAG: alpha-galactosidase, partial [Clostridia bacterium]|nr:alpha-galactosidase [Clostridia bacterium]